MLENIMTQTKLNNKISKNQFSYIYLNIKNRKYIFRYFNGVLNFLNSHISICVAELPYTILQ